MKLDDPTPEPIPQEEPQELPKLSFVLEYYDHGIQSKHLMVADISEVFLWLMKKEVKLEAIFSIVQEPNFDDFDTGYGEEEDEDGTPGRDDMWV